MLGKEIFSTPAYLDLRTPMSVLLLLLLLLSLKSPTQ
jgi:hypothetical protein